MTTSTVGPALHAASAPGTAALGPGPGPGPGDDPSCARLLVPAATNAAAAAAIAGGAVPEHEQRLCNSNARAPDALPSISSLLAAIDDRDRQLRPPLQPHPLPSPTGHPQQASSVPRHKKSISVDSSAFALQPSLGMSHPQPTGALYRHRHNLSTSSVASSGSTATSLNPVHMHSPFAVPPLPPQSPRLAAPFQSMSLHRKSDSIDSITSNGSNFSPVSSSSPSAPRNDTSTAQHRHSTSLSSIEHVPRNAQHQHQLQAHMVPSHHHVNSPIAFASPQHRRIHHARTSSAPVYAHFPSAPYEAKSPADVANPGFDLHAQRFRHRTQLDRLQRDQQLAQFRMQHQQERFSSQEQPMQESNQHMPRNANSGGSGGFQRIPSASNLGKMDVYMDSQDKVPMVVASSHGYSNNDNSGSGINGTMLHLHTQRPQHLSLPGTRAPAIAGGADISGRLNASGNPIKRRLRANREQLQVLEEVFAQTNGTPSAQSKKDLARRLGMPHKSILYWFQNRRAQIVRTQRSGAGTASGVTGAGGPGGEFERSGMYVLTEAAIASELRDEADNGSGEDERHGDEEDDDGADNALERTDEAFESSGKEQE